MLALELVQYLTQALYIIVFLLALSTALHHPRPITVKTAALFGAAALSVGLSLGSAFVGAHPPEVVPDLAAALAMSVPYLLLRLVDEFAGVPTLVQRLADAGLVVAIGSRIVSPFPPPLWVTLVMVAYVALVTLYVTWAFAHGARLSVGSTARRMGAVAVGSGLLAGAGLVVGLQAVFPWVVGPVASLSGPFGLASGMAFYLGFTTPAWVLRVWRQPELVAFMEQVDELAEQPDITGLLAQLQAAVAGALGLRGAFVGLWNEQRQVLEYVATRISSLAPGALDPDLIVDEPLLRTPPDRLVGGKSFTSQQPLYIEDVDEVDEEHAAMYRALGVRAVIAAPITLGAERFGVLGAYAPRPRLFGEESLAWAEALAKHTAHMLRSRHLLERAAAVRVQEEVARLKDEFLSGAAHDLKTPLTGIRGMAQLVERRARQADASEDAKALAEYMVRIRESADRMTTLIDEMLDISRLQMARPLELTPRVVDLVELAKKVAGRHQPACPRHRIVVETSCPVAGVWDGPRLERVLDNLVGNAVKFSPRGGQVLISVSAEQDHARLSVGDEGIGLRPDELEQVFERFERGSNAVERGIGGSGIGLAYVRQVVAAHGGEVLVESQEDQGSVFTLKLPFDGSTGPAQTATA